MADVDEIGLDASGFEQGINEIAEALKKYNISIDDAVDATAKFNRQGELLEATITKVEKDGTKIVQTFGTIENKIIQVTDGMGGLIRRFEDLNGVATKTPTSFGLLKTTVKSAPDSAANQQAFEAAKLAGALRAQQIDEKIKNDAIKFEEQKLAAARRAMQEDDNLRKQRLAKQEAESKFLEDIYEDRLKDYREANKKIEAEAKRTAEDRAKIERRETENQTRLAIARAKANVDAQKPSGIGAAAGAIGARASSILLSQAIIEFNTAIQQSITDSVNFSKQLAAIGTLSQNSTTSLLQFRDGIIEVSNAYGLSRKDVADGTYETISNQIAEGSDAILFQAQAAKLAQATLSSQADAVNALSSILNSYNKGVSETDQISAAFFKTIDLGRLRLGDVANTIGTVTVAASQLGVSYQEVFAGVAELTRQGVTAANAQTFLRNLLNQLIKPTEATAEALNKYGFTTGQAAIQTLGFQGVLKLLATEADGNIEKFGEFGTNIRSLQALLGLAGDGGTKFDKTLKEITASTTEFDNAAKIVAESTGKQFERITTTLGNEFLKIGDLITSTIVKITNSFGGIGNVIDNAKTIFVGFAAAAATLIIPALNALVVTFPAAAAAATTFATALLSIPLVAIAAAIATLAAVASSYVNETEEAFKRAKEIDDETNKIIDKANERRLKLIEESQKEEVKAVSGSIAAIITKYQQFEDKAKTTYKSIFEETDAFGKTLIASQNRIIRNLENENQRSIKAIEDIREKNAQAELRRENEIFEAKVSGSSLQLEVSERLLEIKRLEQKASLAAAAGNEREALQALDLADKQEAKIVKLKESVTKASQEYNNFILDSTKKSFDQQEKIIDLTTDKVFKSIDKLKKALKDVNDRTGDRSGFNSAFIKTFSKELDIAVARTDASANRLRRNLDRLRARGRAVDLDPQTRNLIQSLDSASVKELRYRIRIGDQESVSNILDQIKEQQVLADENAKKQIANNKALFLEQTALSAAKRGDFETERKFLQEAGEIRAKTVDDPAQAQQDFLVLNERIKNSFENQFTVKQKQKEEESTIFKTIKDQLDLQNKQNEAIERRNQILDQIRQREVEEMTKRSAEIAKQQENAVVLQKLFTQLRDVKIDKNSTPTEALKKFNEISAEIDSIISKLSTNPTDVLGNEQIKQKFLEQLQEQEKALNAAALAEKQKDELSKLQQRVQLEKEVRTKVLQELFAEESRLRKQLTETNLAQEKLAAGSLGGFLDFAIGGDDTERIKAEAEKLKIQKQNTQLQLDDVKRIAKAVETANKTGNPIEVINLENFDKNRIKKVIDDLSIPNLTDEAKKNLNLSDLFEDVRTRSQELLDNVGQDFTALKDEVVEPIPITLDTTKIDEQLDTLKTKLLEIRDIKFQLDGGNVEEGEVPGFANGGLVGGKFGIDNNLARLTRGEFVVNARATKNNLSELIKMNTSSQSTMTRNQNVNLNGISINLNASGDAKVDARQIGDELSRLVKLGVLRLS